MFPWRRSSAEMLARSVRKGQWTLPQVLSQSCHNPGSCYKIASWLFHRYRLSNRQAHWAAAYSRRHHYREHSAQHYRAFEGAELERMKVGNKKLVNTSLFVPNLAKREHSVLCAVTWCAHGESNSALLLIVRWKAAIITTRPYALDTKTTFTCII